MPNTNTEETSIGKRLGRTLRQISLRIAYAKGKAEYYENEAKLQSSRGRSYKAMRATVDQRAFEAYARCLTDCLSDMKNAIQNALIGYSTKERAIWYAYFIEEMPIHEIAISVGISERTVHRAVAVMRDEIEFRLSGVQIDERPTAPKWGAKELAKYMNPDPSADYVQAVSDLLAYGAIDIDALELDGWFNDRMEGAKGEGGSEDDGQDD